MIINSNKSISPEIRLRRQAEEYLKAKTSNVELMKGETQRLLHELAVHRVELEMQNVELCQSRDDAERTLEKYSDLYEFAPVGYFTLDRNGTINSVNLRGASLVSVARPRLLGQRFGLLVTDEHRQIFADFLEHSFINQDKTSCEVALKHKENGPLFVQLEAMATITGEECGVALVDITERKLAAADMRNYASRLITMEEELRVKLAAELHDEICRDLTVLGLNMAIISDAMKDVAPKKLISRIKDSGKIIKGVSHTVRNIMVGLRPPMLDDFGLLAALRWHADLFSKRTGVVVSIEADEPFPRFMIEKETALFRISQEALMNVSKHADTQNVTIKLRESDGMILFDVVDKGKGLLAEKSSFNQTGCGWGMTIMRERAELNGGSFRVDSTPGKGTTISVVMPLGVA
jgi:PAS domain S-box-containing protein